MMQRKYSTLQGARTTSPDVVRWARALTQLHARLAPHFARREPCHRALLYLQGILSETERKNGGPLAEHAGEATPYGMQRLLSQAVWDADRVRDELRTYVLEQLGQEAAIVVIDETSFPKRGKKSAGVALQYCGRTGQVENCQIGVAYASPRGHILVDRELYLPKSWKDDQQRCQEAHVPEEVAFYEARTGVAHTGANPGDRPSGHLGDRRYRLRKLPAIVRCSGGTPTGICSSSDLQRAGTGI